jgi:O-antigen ligase
MGYRTIIARFDIYSNAFILIKNYPFGLGVYNIELFLRDDFGTLLNHPHNIILQFFLEIGIIGGVSLLFFLLILFFKGLFLSQSSRVFIVVCTLYFLMNNLSGGFSAVSHLIFWSYLGLSTNFLYNGFKSDA